MIMKPKFKSASAKLQKSVQGIILISPILFLCITILVLLLCILILPDTAIVSKIGLIIIIMAVVLGYFLVMVLMTYLFRDASHKFIAPNISSPLGEKDGFCAYAPKLVKPGKKGDFVVEPQFTIRALSGFSAFGVHTKGRVIAIYPTEFETLFPGGGVACNVWLRACTVNQLPDNVRNTLVRQSATIGIFTDPNSFVWFGRTPFLENDESPRRESWSWDVGRDDYIAEINRLKAIVQEKDFQIESYELSRSRAAFSLRPGEASFADKYNRPPENLDEKTKRLYAQAEAEMAERRNKEGY